jgi:CSLREA domain-containing protein
VLKLERRQPMTFGTAKHRSFDMGSASRTVLVLVLAIGISANFPPAAHAAPTKIPVLQIDAPKQVRVGEAIGITLVVKDAIDIAGYEAAVLYDTTVAEFAGLQQRKNDLKKLRRDIGSLAVEQLPIGSVIGLFSCPTDNCVDHKGAKRNQGGSGTIKLATVDILPSRPGILEVMLGSVKFVDAAGNPVAVQIPSQAISVQVGAAGAGPRFPAPQSSWTLPTSSSGTPGPFDLTRDAQITHADAMEVAIAWELTHGRGAPCEDQIDPLLDVNHDRCIDIADIQMVVAHYDTVPALNSASNSAATANAVAASMTFTVNSTADDADAAWGNGVCQTAAGVCTLRAALAEANAHAGPDSIAFNIPGSGVQTIQLTKALPTLNDANGGTTIDGYTQTGSAANTDSSISNAVIIVQITGSGESGFDAFVVTTPNNVFRGLAIFKVRRSFWIYGSGAHDNTIIGSFVGTNAAGTYGASTIATDTLAHGLHIEQGAANNRVGSTSAAERNVISGNGRGGVGLWHEGTDGNIVMNNIVGLGPRGDRRVSNRLHGVDLNFGVSNSVVGGTGSGERNVLSGNDSTGAEISHTAGTSQNRISGNFIGTDVTGTRAPSFSYNFKYGISVKDRVINNTISDNVVGNNRQGGITIDNFGTCCVTGNVFTNNRVGISIDGTAIPNSLYGIKILAPQSRIGPGNIIANNPVGIQIDGDADDGNRITQNSIYNNTGLGIDLAPLDAVNPNDNGDADSGPNQQLNFPILASATPQTVTGTACAGCTVEIFQADGGAGAYGEGKILLGSTTAGGDGSFATAISGVTAGNYVTATATDTSGNTSEFSLNQVIASGGSNNPPMASAGGSYGVGEGGSIAVTASGSDTEGGTLTYAWDLDNNSTYETPGQSATFSAATFDGPASRTIAVQATDEGGLSATDSTSVSIQNVAPQATFNAPSSVVAGNSIQLSLTSPSDPSSADAAAGFVYAFDCGDGSGYGAFGSSTSASCLTSGTGIRTVKGKLRDKDNGTREYTRNVNVTASGIALPGRFEAEDYRTGGEGVGYHDTTPGNKFGFYRNDSVDIEITRDTSGAYNIGAIAAGEWLAYDINVATSGNYIFIVRVASPNTGMRFHIEVDGVNASGPLTVPQTGGWQTWGNLTAPPIQLNAGAHTVKLVADTSGFNWNYVVVNGPQ